ncbi:hypothetical protein [Erwinia sorbitola]|uniref:Uncharacterized protein n=1 Tax=Erwinia sorbitola TaxID=2681984 RepID=A0ABW9RGJ3_9GAMM|nr:hypothetical protein [Erwinia sorbitola]MTD29343.1 hypothetical protein [Erwinia sorbitola]
MKVSERALMESGFTHADIQKVKHNVENYGGTLDEVIKDLAKRFNISKWVTIVALMILIMSSFFTTPNNTLSLAFSLIVGLPFIWYLTPARLAYKSWRYKKYVSRTEGDQ